jgi:hypothetical protein
MTKFIGSSNFIIQVDEFTFNKLSFLHISVKAQGLNTCKQNAL